MGYSSDTVVHKMAEGWVGATWLILLCHSRSLIPFPQKDLLNNSQIQLD